MLARKQQLLIRYYILASDGLWRLPSRLHYDLMERKVALPQYADTKQKVLEVFARQTPLANPGTALRMDRFNIVPRSP